MFDIFVLSTEFGLISVSKPIPYYDRRLQPKRADELQPQVLAELKQILKERNYKELFISVGRDYLRVLSGYELFVPAGVRVIISAGTPGRKLAELRDWLRGGPPALRLHRANATAHPARASIRGIDITMTAEQVLDTARQALVEGRGAPTRYQSWYVEVDGRRVAPKWLVSMLTGLPVSAFVTDEARRVLDQLGVRVLACDYTDRRDVEANEARHL